LKYILGIFLISSLPTFSFASGYWGSYLITGTATQNGQVLNFKELMVTIGEKDTLINTDENGFYEIIIQWSSFHKVGEDSKEVSKKNPKKIIFTYEGKKIRVKNNWLLSQEVLLNPDKKFEGVKMIEYPEGKSPMLFGDYSPSIYPKISIKSNFEF
jgi:hypothetical protein